MRRINRLQLSQHAVKYLKKWSDQITADEDPHQSSETMWPKKRRTKAIQDVRDTLRLMNGRVAQLCMYCEYNEAGHIDHFEPRSRAPERTFDWLNHLAACDICNSNFKRDRFQRHDGVRPVDPTAEDPREHLRFLPSGKYEPLTDRGTWSIEVYGLDRPLLEQQRRNWWIIIREQLLRFGELEEAGRTTEAEEVKLTLTTMPCVTVLIHLLELAQGPKAEILGLSECQATLEKFPEILDWI